MKLRNSPEQSFNLVKLNESLERLGEARRSAAGQDCGITILRRFNGRRNGADAEHIPEDS